MALLLFEFASNLVTVPSTLLMRRPVTEALRQQQEELRDASHSRKKAKKHDKKKKKSSKKGKSSKKKAKTSSSSSSSESSCSLDFSSENELQLPKAGVETERLRNVFHSFNARYDTDCRLA